MLRKHPRLAKLQSVPMRSREFCGKRFNSEGSSGLMVFLDSNDWMRMENSCRTGQSIPSSFGKREFSEASKDPNLSNHVIFFQPSSFQTTCCCSTLEHTLEIHQNGFRFYNPFLGRFDWVVHLPPASGDIIRKEPVGCPGWWQSAMPSITPFSAMAKAVSPPLRPWF